MLLASIRLVRVGLSRPVAGRLGSLLGPLDVAIHDPATAAVPRATWIERIRKFGVRVDEPFVLLPPKEVGPITRLSAKGTPTVSA